MAAEHRRGWQRARAGVALLLVSMTAVPDQPDDTPEAAVAAFWQALSHGSNAGADAEALNRLLHAEAKVFGARMRDGAPVLSTRSAASFVEAVAAVEAEPFHECEIWRVVQRYDRFAQIYSVVESRRLPHQAKPDFIGVNSLQLYRDDGGWKILSLYYHVESPGLPVSGEQGKSGICLQ